MKFTPRQLWIGLAMGGYSLKPWEDLTEEQRARAEVLIKEIDALATECSKPPRKW